jgi:hypothetical protein
LPNGAFFGARKANEALHLLYHYGTGEVLASSNAAQPSGKLKAAVRVLALDGREKWAQDYGKFVKQSVFLPFCIWVHVWIIPAF